MAQQTEISMINLPNRLLLLLNDVHNGNTNYCVLRTHTVIIAIIKVLLPYTPVYTIPLVRFQTRKKPHHHIHAV